MEGRKYTVIDPTAPAPPAPLYPPQYPPQQPYPDQQQTYDQTQYPPPQQPYPDQQFYGQYPPQNPTVKQEFPFRLLWVFVGAVIMAFVCFGKAQQNFELWSFARVFGMSEGLGGMLIYSLFTIIAAGAAVVTGISLFKYFTNK
ncbi:MAG: hypothetical protein LBU20_02400 [Candidatus Nomurabacteria bacterium]|nr:hypothetical protein [Candidatus Nomurabacteria bacterium]